MVNHAGSDFVQNHPRTANDNVQNHVAIASRFRTKSSPGDVQFFIGCSPSQAATIINPKSPAAGVMVSINALRDRKSDFVVEDWILDSGAFTEVARHGGYRYGVEQYYWQICRWHSVGNLLIAVAQDWMCEPFVLARTGLSIARHQELTIERYDQLLNLNPPAPIMPVLQGYQSSDYLIHLQQYGDRLPLGQWIGVGSVCKRNGNPGEIANILRGIKLLRPDLRLHGFGLKAIALESPEIRSLLYSCDSMAWSYPARFKKSPGDDSVRNRDRRMAHDYQQGIAQRIAGTHTKTIPKTAGAGNGQGRKPEWKNPTKAVRLPEIYIPDAIELCRKLEAKEMKELGWMRWPRKESEDEFYEEYRGFNIYLSIPNGGILGGSIIQINSKKKAWLYMSEHLEDPHYLDEEWHLNNCREKINRLLKKWEEKPKKIRKNKQEKAEENGQLTLDLGV